MSNEIFKKWWFNEDGTFKCFGKPTYYNWQSFHCAHLLDSDDCNKQLQRECWKRDDRVWAFQEMLDISKDEAEKKLMECDENAGCYVDGEKVPEDQFWLRFKGALDLS